MIEVILRQEAAYEPRLCQSYNHNMHNAKLSASSLGVSDYEGKKIVTRFDTECPSFKVTAKSASDWAKQNGFMRTISKRRRRFPRGEGSFKALNFLTQGKIPLA